MSLCCDQVFTGTTCLTPPPFQEVPDELWELLELEKLNLSLNSLKVLPPQLAVLSNLVVLNLWGNQVSITCRRKHDEALKHLIHKLTFRTETLDPTFPIMQL